MKRSSPAQSKPGKRPGEPGQRSRLLRPTTLILLAVAVGIMLLLLFPKVDFSDPALSAEPNELTTGYLRVMLRSRPDDARLRLLLAKNQLALARLQKCRKTLLPLLEMGGGVGRKARLLDLEVTKALYHGKEGTPEGKRLFARAKAQLAALRNENLRPSELRRLTQISLELGLPGITGELFDRLAASDPEDRPNRYATAARWYLAAGRYSLAARALLRASITARKPAHRLAHALKAVDVWVGAGDPRRALLQARSLMPRFPGEVLLMERTIALARATGHNRLAFQLNAELLKKSPRSELLITRHIALARITEQLALARQLNLGLLLRRPNDRRLLARQIDLDRTAGDNDAAYAMARRLHRLQPANKNTRRLLIQLARWTGRPDEALDHLVWLAEQGSAAASREAFKLAGELKRPRVTAHLLRMHQARRLLTAREIARLVAALEAAGEPEKAVEVLKERLNALPREVPSWQLLAELFTRLGDYPGALAASRSLTKFQGTTRDEIVRQARLIWMQGRPGAALALMRGYSRRADRKDGEFWQLMGELAWDQGESEEMLQAYLNLFQQGEKKPNLKLVERLVHAAILEGRLREAVAVGWAAQEKVGKPYPLFQALYALMEAGQWKEMDRHLKRYGKTDGAAEQVDYWLLVARLSQKLGNPKQAKAALERAMAKSPGSRAVRLAWIWLAIDHDQGKVLRQALRDWADTAAIDQEYWVPFAVAYGRLKEPHNAIEWWKRLAERNPHDIQYIASYADALDLAGRPTEAWRLRRYVITRLKGRAVDTLARFIKKAKAGAEARRTSSYMANMRDTVIAFGRVIWQLRGQELARRWFHPVMHYAWFDQTVQRFAVTWHLAQNNLGRARTWLTRQKESGQEPPAHQRLAFALAEADGGALADLLGSGDSDLPVMSRVGTLASLGRYRSALKLAKAHARTVNYPSDAQVAQIGQTLLSLERAAGSWVQSSAGWTAIGGVDQLSVKIASQIQLGDFAVEGLAEHQSLLLTPDTLLMGGSFERWHVRLGGAYIQRDWKARVSLGANIRDTGDATFSPGLLLEYRPWSAALVQVEGVYGELADDTAALRLYGLRSRAMARLQWAITRRFDLDLAAGWAHHAVAATGEFVGQGVSGQGHLAYAISLLNPLLRVRVGANGGHNWLAPEIPAGLAARLRTGATMAAVLPDKFFTAGAGATIAQVLLGGWNRPGTQLRCQLDAWVGYWWPENLLTYRLEAGLVWRFLARHQLLVGFSYGNQQGATAGQPSAAVGLKYEYRFAK